MEGTIVAARGDGWGFDSVFQPGVCVFSIASHQSGIRMCAHTAGAVAAGSATTLAEAKPDSVSARYLAVWNLVNRVVRGHTWSCNEPIMTSV